MMFNRPAHLVDVKDESPVGKMMVNMEAAFIAGDVDGVEKGYAYFMMNMGNCGASGRIEDGNIAEYLEQFDSIFA